MPAGEMGQIGDRNLGGGDSSEQERAVQGERKGESKSKLRSIFDFIR